MYPTILVAVEDPVIGGCALPLASALASAGPGRLILAHALVDEALRPHAEAFIARMAEECRSRSVAVEHDLGAGDPGRFIVAAADRWNADFIVMATDRSSNVDRWLNGSVADWVLRHTLRPVAMVPATPDRQLAYAPASNVLVPLDGMRGAEAAIEPASVVARLTGGGLVLMRAIDSAEDQQRARGYLDAVASRLSMRGCDVSVAVGVGDPASVIVHMAEATQAGLIAMATHARSGIARLRIGSVATETLQQSSVPVMLLRCDDAAVEAAPIRASSPANTER
jgi:nucleotide-binding universal stress UspA family protein